MPKLPHARAAARPPGPDRDRDRGRGRGPWTMDPWPVVRGPWSVVWVWDWAGLGLAWLGMAWLGLDWDWAWAQNPYLFTPNPFGFQSIGLPTNYIFINI